MSSWIIPGLSNSDSHLAGGGWWKMEEIQSMMQALLQSLIVSE